MKKLAVISTHPIQYNAPWFKLLAAKPKVDLKVFYTWSQAQERVKDKTFGRDIQWDIPLLEGYDYEFVENVSKNAGSHHFFGIDNPALITRIKAFDPDAILVFGWNFKSHLKVLRHFKGQVPLWFRGDSTLLDEVPGFKTFLRRFVLRWVYRYVDKAFYVGTANKAYFMAHGLRPHQLVYAPHAIDNDRFGDEANQHYLERAKAWRKELGFFEKDIVVLFAGKFESKKQPDFLIKSLIAANKDRCDTLKLVLVGQGPLEADLKLLAKPYDFITFIPFVNQSEMPIVYRLADVYCLPSKGPGETWGLAVNEAMASGRPVIVSDKVGCAIDMVNNNTGFVFKHDDVTALVDILRQLHQHDLNVMAMHAKVHVKAWSFNGLVGAIKAAVIGNDKS
jgi:glycosyltransferase involved in cell wall biosynthesis